MEVKKIKTASPATLLILFQPIFFSQCSLSQYTQKVTYYTLLKIDINEWKFGFGVVVEYIMGTFDPAAFINIFGSFSVPVSKWSVTRK